MEKINVLLIGSGGREHAMARSVAASPLLNQLYCAPGNPGISDLAQLVNLSVDDFDGILSFCIQQNVQLIVVGPELPLVLGLTDFIQQHRGAHNIVVLGPSREAAQLEGSKRFAKEFMQRHGIPTAAYQAFGVDQKNEALNFLSQLAPPFVLKADGLAAGKGVLICQDMDEAVEGLNHLMGGMFGDAGKEVVIEQFLSGIEVSVFVLTDGQHYVMLPEAKDYKRIMDGDLGPNTGGMGAVSPVSFVTPSFMEKVVKRIVEPTIEGIRKEGLDYKGFVFFGLMKCGDDPFVIEYNCRLGDPETEAILPRIEDDLLARMYEAARGQLRSAPLAISDETSIAVVLVSGGYPGNFVKGKQIELPHPTTAQVFVYHAGTGMKDNQLVTQGGRVFAVVAKDMRAENAKSKAYNTASSIHFDGVYYRKDIGKDLGI
jgi:phosphoribosylamine--glycine ligase